MRSSRTHPLGKQLRLQCTDAARKPALASQLSAESVAEGKRAEGHIGCRASCAPVRHLRPSMVMRNPIGIVSYPPAAARRFEQCSSVRHGENGWAGSPSGDDGGLRCRRSSSIVSSSTHARHTQHDPCTQTFPIPHGASMAGHRSLRAVSHSRSNANLGLFKISYGPRRPDENQPRLASPRGD